MSGVCYHFPVLSMGCSLDLEPKRVALLVNPNKNVKFCSAKTAPEKYPDYVTMHVSFFAISLHSMEVRGLRNCDVTKYLDERINTSIQKKLCFFMIIFE